MQLIENVRELLSGHPRLRVEDDGRTLTAPAADRTGFDVTLCAEETGYTVWLGPWHQHFELAEEQSASDCFVFGLSGESRLLVKSRGTRDYSWTLEALEQGEWRTYSTTALLFFPFWRRRTVRHLRNQPPRSGPNNSSKPTPLRGAA
ncbi:hypothetical protein GCM10027188_29720 [Lysobacter humi (ex Lee et al. 2017)]